MLALQNFNTTNSHFDSFDMAGLSSDELEFTNESCKTTKVAYKRTLSFKNQKTSTKKMFDSSALKSLKMRKPSADSDASDDECSTSSTSKLTFAQKLALKGKKKEADASNSAGSEEEKTKESLTKADSISSIKEKNLTEAQIQDMKDKLKVKRTKASLIHTHPRVLQNLMRLYNIQPTAAPADAEC
eukprot:CAMPEP_0114587344 /NCGR_PEP_ID=MMETSP0125-20121206/10323_1 /TAXON_ID=485358 ORGANISM="Aristerostoma sp., Strain ATCC 50986" /NCGR_SAMPLE_ID=MMETSP0125 /ASSEMBLY_ACC=CAM_ASM_000245 /LENGTH=185 /DNA_ID=CAMNT_0001783199 /DNA_START=81 /DNA_END=638 /DNA_ORIENTATION=+